MILGWDTFFHKNEERRCNGSYCYVIEKGVWGVKAKTAEDFCQRDLNHLNIMKRRALITSLRRCKGRFVSVAEFSPDLEGLAYSHLFRCTYLFTYCIFLPSSRTSRDALFIQ